MNDPILQMVNITKRFPGVLALDNVTLDLFPGEVLGLLGENGAGKSTLVKILSGVYPKDGGTIRLDGREIEVNSPHHAQSIGLTIIHQELSLMPALTVAENVFIGREPNRLSFVQRKSLNSQTRALTQRLGINLSPTTKVRSLSTAQQQMVEIARALSVKSRVIIMDEPTSSLTDNEVQHLFDIIGGLKAQGIGIIFISHRLDEVFQMCNRITVLRDGANVGTVSSQEATPDQIIHMMVGRPVSDLFAKESAAPGQVMLEVNFLNRRPQADYPTAIALHDIHLKVRAGEIVGIAGLVGSGRTDLARCIFGVDERDSGDILIDSRLETIRSPRDAIRAGMGLVPEDRKLQALFLGMSVEANATIASLGRVSAAGFVRRRHERALASKYVGALSIRLARLEQRILELSGGNQQKVIVARWLALKPRILIMDEPTRGIDVGAKAEVHALMTQLARDGVAILMISSELPEILGMSDRILVMREGSLVGEVQRAEATPPLLMSMMTGQYVG